MHIAFRPTRLSAAGFLTHKRIPAYIALLLILCLQNPLRAQHNSGITGVVTDTSGMPLSGVHVVVVDLQEGTVTSWSGEFSFPSLAKGNFSLSISRLGYKPEIVHGIGTNEGAETHVQVKLVPTPISLPSAEVHQSTLRTVYAGKQIESIKRSAWEEVGAANIGDVLRYIPGVAIHEGDGIQRVSLRGSPVRAVKVDMDGIPLNDAATGEAQTANIDLHQLEEIIVEFNGMGGEIHLLTQETEPQFGESERTQLYAENGGRGGSDYSIRYRTSVREVDFNLSANRTQDDGDFDYRLEDGTRFKRINNYKNNLNGLGRMSFMAVNWVVSGGIYLDKSERGIPGLIYSAPSPEASLSGSRISAQASIKRLDNPVGLEVSGFYSEYRSHYINPRAQFNPSTGQVVLHIPDDTKNLGLRYGFTSSVQPERFIEQLRIIHYLRVDQYSSKDLLRNNSVIGMIGQGSAKRTSNELECSWQNVRVIGRTAFQTNPSVSVAHYNDSGGRAFTYFMPSISVSASSRIRFGIISVNSSWGRNFTPPPFNASFMVESIFAVGNKNLKPEKGETTTIGLSYRSLESFRGEAIAGINWYYRNINDLIIWKRNFQNKYYPDNLNETKAKGIETYFEYRTRKPWISLAGTYIYNNSIIDTPGDINQGNTVPLIAKHSGSVRTSFTSSGLRLSLTGRWIGRRYSTASNLDPLSLAGMGLSPYSVYDAGLSKSWLISPVTIRTEFRVENMFDENYRVVERSPMPGRGYWVSINLTHQGRFQ